MTKNTKIIIGIIIVVLIISRIWYIENRKSNLAENGYIKIGVLTSLTGPVAEYGNNTKQGLNLAVEEINNKGGVNRSKFQLLYEDSKCDPKEAVTGFNKLVNGGVSVILGTICSSEVLAVAPLANQKYVLVISNGATSPEITKAGDYIFRAYTSDDYEAGVAAETIAKKLNKSKVSILYLNNDYGVALKKAFRDKFSALGGEILNEEGYAQDAKDFRTQLTKIKAKSPEVVYMISYPIDGGVAIKQAKELGINAIFFGTTGIKANDFLSTAGSAAEGLILATALEPSSNKRNEFLKNFENQFGTKPGLVADSAYDSVYVLVEALKGAKNIESVKNNLYKIKGFDGASREISFDSNGDLMDVKFGSFIVKNGQFIPYTQ